MKLLPLLCAGPALACMLLLAPPCPAVTADGFMWHNTRLGQTDYLPLEDLRSFYKLIPMQGAEGAHCVGNGELKVTFGPDTRDITLNGIRCRLSHPTRRAENGDLLVSKVDMVKLIDPVLRPTYIHNRRTVKTVVVDAGHGGHDAGTATPYVREADTTLLVAAALRAELEKRGFLVLLTHEDNRYLSDQQRVDAANAAANAVFISLHLNNGRSDMRGVETYTVDPAESDDAPMPGNEYDTSNAALAMALQSSLVRRCGAADGGCRRAHYSILSSVSCPAALVELGYAGNKEEGTLLSSEEYRGKLAKALAEGIATFAEIMNPETSLQQREQSSTSSAKPATPPTPVKPAEPVKTTPAKPAPTDKKKAGTTRSNTQRSTPARNTKRSTTPARRTPANPAPARRTQTKQR